MILTQAGWRGPALCISLITPVAVWHGVWVILIKWTFNLKSPIFLEYSKSDYLICKFSIDRIIKLPINYYKLSMIILFFLSHSSWLSLFFSNCFLTLSFKVNFGLEINLQKTYQGKKNGLSSWKCSIHLHHNTDNIMLF